MDIAVNTIIVIDGTRLNNFDSLTLKQKIYDHHEFEIIVDQEVIDKMGSHTIEESRDWLNKSVVIALDQKDFLGIVTEIYLQHADGFNGKIVIKGYSKTILLESGNYFKSWFKKPISFIVNETLRNARNLDVFVKPENDFTLTYESQYQESYFQFLKRLSKQRLEWFYYDGLRLVFGKPHLDEAIDVFYGESITELTIGMGISSHTPSFYAYNALEDTMSVTKPKDDIAGLNELGAYAYTLSKEIYPDIPMAQSPTPINNKYELDQAVRKTQYAESARLNTIKGKSSDKRLGVGTVINIRSAKYDKKSFIEKPYGIYIIIAITHSASGGHEYSNEFEAIPGAVRTLPVSSIALPKASSQLATVISNQDPENKGRVQVRYHWMDNNMHTDWLRVSTIHAGSSQNHPQNRGCVFVPEVADQVIIHFLQNDPNQGYVAGSLFTGKTGAGGKDKNGIKSIATSSGHMIEFNDNPNQESITIIDKNKSIIFVDTVNSSIRISAPENISISAKNIDISASENLTVGAGKNMGINAGDDITMGAGKDTTITASEDMNILAKNITEQASENFESLATISSETHAESITKNSTKDDIKINSNKGIKNNSSDKLNLF